ncbi:hypothetical protein MRB53_005745 [Persea americana]|uniref:Uncharacterized protein n=1 Tax=Persea americana TaxID=3435 RepID=A0ACC2MFU5_PERAE|nr:hypothetical protein MRB53_005745 [Persea americana]|eukprot:TRINITY_DN37827_c0_g1_i1.p1 TRINITY_DN37827_c0_g1~~TRINITY_DN37827_c0_g1_i1.p1  ORF type:complete len:115 (-),score=15.54 TRINITY_DN37827_c0_g1_i1:288-632(-)
MQRDCFTAVGLPEDGDLDCSARPQSPNSDCSSILSSGTGIVRPPCCLSYPMEVAARTAVRRRAKQSSPSLLSPVPASNDEESGAVRPLGVPDLDPLRRGSGDLLLPKAVSGHRE